MRIMKFEAENVKRLKAVSITPDGSLVVIKGQNAQGKTSVLDAISYALGGKELHPPEVIRRGETHAQVVVELDDLVVERKWTPKGTTLSVRGKDGGPFKSPQAVLDRLVGALTFDPLAFQRMEPKKQVEVVQQLVGLDFEDHERRRAAVYEQRTEVNRELARAKAAVGDAPVVENAEEVSYADFMAEQEQALNTKAANDAIRQKLRDAQARYTATKSYVDAAHDALQEAERQVAIAKERVVHAEKQLSEVTDEGKALRAQVEALVDPDTASIRNRIAAAEEFNRQARAAKEMAAKARVAAGLEEKSKALTASIDAMDQQKAEAIAAAKFPVDGLGFGPDGLTFKGLPLSQASGAEQLRVSLAMGLALNPKLKVLLIRDASLLDENSLAMVAKMAEQAGAQVWLEMVGTGGPVGVVIEDGEAFAEEPRTQPAA